MLDCLPHYLGGWKSDARVRVEDVGGIAVHCGGGTVYSHVTCGKLDKQCAQLDTDEVCRHTFTRTTVASLLAGSWTSPSSSAVSVGLS